jgi:hypothetical protein
MARLVTIDITELHAMIATSVRAVLDQRNVILAKPSDCQYPLDEAATAKLVAEIGRNVAGVVAMLDESEVAA